MSMYLGNKCIAGAGNTPAITIRESDKHWLIDGKDTGIVAEGDSVNVTIGNVEKGVNPSVTNSGTGNDVVLNFVLPQGDKGDKGERGEKGEKGEPGTPGTSGTSNYDELINAPSINKNNQVYSYQTNISNGQIRNIYFSTAEPTATDGMNGDIWVVYDE